MAITKIFAIKERLDARLDYVLDKEKTTSQLIHPDGEDEGIKENKELYLNQVIKTRGDSTTSDPLSDKIHYALNREKTESI